MTITVLRLGHRPQRDKRLSTHLILCARALGAEKVIYTGMKDPKLEEGISNVVNEWGGSFELEYTSSHRSVIMNWNGKMVHLTMYGLQAHEAINEVKENDEPLLIVVGGAKVPWDVYEEADWNISVTTQPHSEVSALAIFMHLLQGDAALQHEFPGGRLKITPNPRGKDVEVEGGHRKRGSAKTKSSELT
jgi:tRNA (cytidine56-2'-O)-methyltransferase